MEWQGEDYHRHPSLRKIVLAVHFIQETALNVDSVEKRNQETFSMKNSGDFFRKIVILDGNAKASTDDDGIMYVGVIPFLLDDSALI